jgi:fumarylacetoacetase
VDYPEDSPFSIQNIPFGIARHPSRGSFAVTAIGEYVVDLFRLHEAGLLALPPELRTYDLESLFQKDGSWMREARKRLFELLHEDKDALQSDHDLQGEAFLAQSEIQMLLPSRIGAYVDFYSGVHHASNVGRMFRPEQPPLLPNYKWVPIAYNGRASSVVPSGSEIRRPKGQIKPGAEEPPVYAPTQELDFELEMGFFVGAGTELGQTVSADDADQMIAGLVIVNDWSSRDVQRWEYQPLGPFLAKTFATSISPWVVTLDALEPFRIAGQPQDPEPLPYLRQSASKHFDLELEVSLQSAKMTRPQVICRSNMRHLYWSVAQQLTHQCSNGTNVQPGDLYASGTISGTDKGSFGSMLELTWRGQEPICLEETGEYRRFLEDGDEVVMTAFAQAEGYRVGFGEVRGRILPAILP